MDRHEGNDELFSRIARIDPANSRPTAHGRDAGPSGPPCNGATSVRRVWTWWKFQLASLGALVGSGAVAVAAILGIQAAAPSLPILALGASANERSVPSSAAMVAYLKYVFTSDSALSGSGGTGEAYLLVSTDSAATVAAAVAHTFGVSGPVVALATVPSRLDQ